jgi:hypothetical protein
VPLATLQSAAHLAVVLGTDRVGTLVDLDHSNGVPDLVSTAALAGGVPRAVVLAW